MDNLTIQIDPTEKAILERKAAAQGRSLPDLLRESAALVGDFSPFLQQKVQGLCARYGITPSVAIETVVLARLAELEARAEVWGEGPKVLPEFQAGAAGPLTGTALFTILKAQKLDEIETERITFLRRKLELTRAESEWLKSHNTH